MSTFFDQALEATASRNRPFEFRPSLRWASTLREQAAAAMEEGATTNLTGSLSMWYLWSQAAEMPGEIPEAEFQAEYSLNGRLPWKPGMTYAQAMWAKEWALEEMKRDAIMDSSQSGALSAAAQFAGGMAGVVSGPVDLATLFATGGIAGLAAKGTAGSLLARQVGARFGAQRVLDSMYTGARVGLVDAAWQEAIIYPIQQEVGQQYSLSESAANVGLSALLGAGAGGLARGFREFQIHRLVEKDKKLYDAWVTDPKVQELGILSVLNESDQRYSILLDQVRKDNVILGKEVVDRLESGANLRPDLAELREAAMQQAARQSDEAVDSVNIRNPGEPLPRVKFFDLYESSKPAPALPKAAFTGSGAAQKAVSFTANALGREMRFFDPKTLDYKVNGRVYWSRPDVLFVREGAGFRDTFSYAGHELYHSIVIEQPELAYAMFRAFARSAGASEEEAGRTGEMSLDFVRNVEDQALRSRYTLIADMLSSRIGHRRAFYDIVDEAAADTFGAMFRSANFWEALRGQSRSYFDRTANSLIKLALRLTDEGDVTYGRPTREVAEEVVEILDKVYPEPAPKYGTNLRSLRNKLLGRYKALLEADPELGVSVREAVFRAQEQAREFDDVIAMPAQERRPSDAPLRSRWEEDLGRFLDKKKIPKGHPLRNLVRNYFYTMVNQTEQLEKTGSIEKVIQLRLGPARKPRNPKQYIAHIENTRKALALAVEHAVVQGLPRDKYGRVMDRVEALAQRRSSAFYVWVREPNGRVREVRIIEAEGRWKLEPEEILSEVEDVPYVTVESARANDGKLSRQEANVLMEHMEGRADHDPVDLGMLEESLDPKALEEYNMAERGEAHKASLRERLFDTYTRWTQERIPDSGTVDRPLGVPDNFDSLPEFRGSAVEAARRMQTLAREIRDLQAQLPVAEQKVRMLDPEDDMASPASLGYLLVREEMRMRAEAEADLIRFNLDTRISELMDLRGAYWDNKEVAQLFDLTLDEWMILEKLNNKLDGRDVVSLDTVDMDRLELEADFRDFISDSQVGDAAAATRKAATNVSDYLRAVLRKAQEATSRGADDPAQAQTRIDRARGETYEPLENVVATKLAESREAASITYNRERGYYVATSEEASKQRLGFLNHALPEVRKRAEDVLKEVWRGAKFPPYRIFVEALDVPEPLAARVYDNLVSRLGIISEEVSWKQVVEEVAEQLELEIHLRFDRVQELLEDLSSRDPEDPFGSIQGWLDGSYTTGGVRGANNVQTARALRQAHDMQPVLAVLHKHNMFGEFERGRITEYIFQELEGISTGNPAYREIAEVIQGVRKGQVNALNKAGAQTRWLDGFSISTIHNFDQIRKSPQAWKDFLSEHLDWEAMQDRYARYSGRGTDEPLDQEEFLDELYNTLLEEYQERNSGRAVESGNVLRSLSQHRELLFRKGAQYKYEEAFGNGNPAHTLFEQIMRNSDRVAIAQEMGPDWKWTMSRLLEHYDLPKNKQLSLEGTASVVTGEANTPVNFRLGQLGQAVLKVNNLLALGKSAISAMADMATMASTLRWLGEPFGKAEARLLSAMGKAFRRQLLETPKTRASGGTWDRLAGVGAGHQALLSSSSARLYSEGPAYYGKLTRMHNFFWRANGMNLWNTTAEHALIDVLSQVLAEKFQASVRRGRVVPEVARALSRAGITEEEFLNMGAFLDKDPSGTTRLLADRVDEGSGKKLGLMYHDLMRQGIIAAFASDEARIYRLFGEGGLRAGTKHGTAIRVAAQYLPFMSSLVTRTYGRLGRGYGAKSFQAWAFSGFAGSRVEFLTTAASMLFMGWFTQSLKDLTSGREPVTFLSGDQRNTGNMLRILASSGLAGYADQLFDVTESPLDAFGPLASNSIDLAGSLVGGNSYGVTRDTLKLLPFNNHPLVAEPGRRALAWVLGDVFGAHYYEIGLANRDKFIEMKTGQSNIAQ